MVEIVDGSGAGSGDLEILVEGGKVTSSVRSLGGQKFKAAFTPHQPLPHRVDIRFNGDTVPGKWNFFFSLCWGYKHCTRLIKRINLSGILQKKNG